MRAVAVAVALGAPLVAGAPAQAMDMGSMPMDAPPAAIAPGVTASSMFIVGTPEEPLVSHGPRGPLWTIDDRAAMQGVIPAGALDQAGTRLTLTTAQATEKLSKTCQKLVKKSTKGMSKADKKKRTACLAQRTKLIKDSKNSGSTSPSTGGTGTSPSPSTPSTTNSPAATPVPGSAAPTPTPTPGSGSSPTPTPAPGGGPTPTPTPTPTPSTCMPASSITVTTAGIAAPLGVSSTCASAGSVTFTYVVNDAAGHTLDLLPVGGGNEIPIINSAVGAGTTVAPPVTVPAGKYTLFCDRHALMKIAFEAV